MAGSTTPGTVSAQLVEAMRALAGSHPGFRPAHAKGIVCSGTFRGALEARRVSRAPHLQGQAVPTIIRFSNASGNPDVHDGLANTRALSVKFQLPDGQSADVLANSIEGFPVRTPEGLSRVPAGAATGPGHRPAPTRCGSPISGQSPHCPRSH